MYSSYYGTNSVTSNAVSTAEGVGVWIMVAAILAIIGGILAYFLFTKSKTAPKGKFLVWLKDFLNFRIMWIESVLKIMYHILTIFVILASFSNLALGGYGVLMFFITLVFGPILVRIAYEATLMFVMIWRNTKDIADNTKKK